MSRDRKESAGFNHSPFKSLKGLSVSGAKPSRPPAPAVPPPPAAEVADDRELFAQEMRWMEVRPLEGKTVAPPVSAPTTAAETKAPADVGSAEFLTAVGRLDKTFQDEIPDEAEAPRARPRRMKQLERGELRPGGELDLHGLTRDEALARTRAFLAHAARQGWPVVLVVTGKGLRSAEGPVLRQAVERLCDELREVVMEWGEAPRRFGGAGALAVFLRTGKRE